MAALRQQKQPLRVSTISGFHAIERSREAD
jgi:hypothetical protein